MKNKGYNVTEFPNYLHEFIDHRSPVPGAKLYPNELLPAFIKHLNEFWIANHAYEYFEKRAPEVLPYLNKLNGV